MMVEVLAMYSSNLRLFIIALVAVFAASSASAANPSERIYLSNPYGGAIRGLIIGIDAYEHVPQLKGAVADARDIESSLRMMGTTDVVTLIDAKANRSSILQIFSDLVQRTNANDMIILSIAGHGSQEPERIKGTQPDGLEDVFLLPGFEPTPQGSQQRILGSEFNHFIRQFELRGAKVLFVADTCHGGGMAREIDPRAGEMSFRQVPSYKLSVDTLKPVTNETERGSDLDLDQTVFVAAVDRNTKAPEVRIPGLDGLRGALSYAIARAFEGSADADHDGKVTLKELFANVRQVVYQLSDQRQSIVTSTSPSLAVDTDVLFNLTRGINASTTPAPLMSSNASILAPIENVKGTAAAKSIDNFVRSDTPIRLASLDGKQSYFKGLIPRETKFEIVRPIDNPDLLWDPDSRDVIAWTDVIAYQIDQNDLANVIDRTAAIRELKKISTMAPQLVRIAPDDRRQHSGQDVKIELSNIAERSIVLFNVSGDGTIQKLYPVGSDAVRSQASMLEVTVRVTKPFGAEQIIVVTSAERLTELDQALTNLNQRRASDLLVKTLLRYMPADARVGSIGFFTAP
jgi:Caspase domain